MIIERIEIHHVALPLKEPWSTAFGTETEIHSILVGFTSNGVTGWGEAAPGSNPWYSPEWAGGTFELIAGVLAPKLIGSDVLSGSDLQEHLSCYKGNFFAKAAVDLAWWDLDARLRSLPLWRSIGGVNRSIELGADIPALGNLERLLSHIREGLEVGFRRTKLKFRRDWGLDMVRCVRETFPELVMHVDCNAGFSLDDIEMFKELDELGLAMIEQPLGHDDLLDHARLQNEIETPICLDESLTSVEKIRKAIEIGACRWVNLKTGRLGGLTSAIAAHDFCQAKDIGCWVGGMLESSVGQGASIALATLPNIRYPCDIFPTRRLFEKDLGEPEIELSGPSLDVSDRLGSGFFPNRERLSKLVRKSAEIDIASAPGR